MSRASGRDRARDAMDESSMLEADHFGMTFWPAIDFATGSVQLRRMIPDCVPVVIWRRFTSQGEASDIFVWMSEHQDQWHYWGRLVILFGEQALEAIAVQAALLDAGIRAAEEERVRLEREDQERRHRKIELFILDNATKRPGLSLASGDEKKPFFVMRFSEKWERERVLDWLRWQKHRFLEFRNLHASEGADALERVIIAGMRATEIEIKAAGTAFGGRRPLRFWRGE